MNGNGGHECNCTEQEHTDSGLTWTRIRETARILRSLLISTKAARGIVAASKYILLERFLRRGKSSQLLRYYCTCITRLNTLIKLFMNLRISRTLFQWIWIHLTGVLLVGFWPLFGLSPRCSDLVSLAKFPSNLHLSKVNKIFIVDVSTGTSNNALFSPQTQSVGQNSLRNQRSWLKAWTTPTCDLSGNFWLKEPLKGPKFFKVSHFEGKGMLVIHQ